MEVRLQKFIADAGIASRRASEKLIADGYVTVNGEVVTQMGIKIDPSQDEVMYKNKVLKRQTTLEYFLLHKPTRVVSTASDEKGRTNVVDLVKSPYRLYPVGRLDYMSSGLILLTNDGDLTYKLTHPKHEITKEYLVKVEPPISIKQIKMLSEGVDLDGERTQPCEIKLMKDNGTTQDYSILLREGKNRQIRRMVELVGSTVVTLERVAIGNIRINRLKYAQYRPLTKSEIDYLKGL